MCVCLCVYVCVCMCACSISIVYPTADYDYRFTSQALTFEDTTGLRSQQCVQIEVFNDSTAEFWEMFTVLLSL